eukprot:6487766-Alexandrium_andersonii.AAC.1
MPPIPDSSKSSERPQFRELHQQVQRRAPRTFAKRHVIFAEVRRQSRLAWRCLSVCLSRSTS